MYEICLIHVFFLQTEVKFSIVDIKKWKELNTSFMVFFIDDDNIRERTNQRFEKMQLQRNGWIFQAQVRRKEKSL